MLSTSFGKLKRNVTPRFERERNGAAVGGITFMYFGCKITSKEITSFRCLQTESFSFCICYVMLGGSIPLRNTLEN